MNRKEYMVFWESKCPLCGARFALHEMEVSLCGIPTVLVTQHTFSSGRSQDVSEVFSLFDVELAQQIEAWLMQERDTIKSDLHNVSGLTVCLMAQIMRHYTDRATTYLTALGFTPEDLAVPTPKLPNLMKLWMFCERDDRRYQPGTPPREQLIALKREALASLTAQ